MAGRADQVRLAYVQPRTAPGADVAGLVRGGEIRCGTAIWQLYPHNGHNDTVPRVVVCGDQFAIEPAARMLVQERGKLRLGQVPAIYVMAVRGVAEVKSDQLES